MNLSPLYCLDTGWRKWHGSATVNLAVGNGSIEDPGGSAEADRECIRFFGSKIDEQ